MLSKGGWITRIYRIPTSAFVVIEAYLKYRKDRSWFPYLVGEWEPVPGEKP